MGTDPTGSPPTPSAPQPAPPTPPAPGASRDDWRAWRRANRDYMHAQWRAGGPPYSTWGWGSWGGWGLFWGVALVLIGAYALLSNLGLLDWLRGDILWPSLLILLGIVLLVRRGRGGWW